VTEGALAGVFAIRPAKVTGGRLSVTFDQLRIFLAVAEREHVTRAAEALNLTQSTVSGAIAALEGRHNVKLFHRIGRRIELTEEGRIFSGEARTILATVRSAEAILADLGGAPRGNLSVFASQTIASYWLPQHLVNFRELYPQVDLHLEAGNTAQCVRAVNVGAADLGFIEGVIDDPGVLVELVAHDRLVIVVGHNHPWAERVPQSPLELCELQWVLRENGSGTRSSFEEAMRLHGVPSSDLRVAIELPSSEGICNAVATGRFATAVSESVAQAGVDAGRLVIVPFDLPSRAFNVIRQCQRQQSRAGKAFVEMIVGRAKGLG
jgi:DNA-binding transcriptional LysR family regulator